jgi:hypothetical protein
VHWTPLNRAGCAFLDACAGGATLGEAANAALDVEPDTNIAQLLENMITAGALARPSSARVETESAESHPQPAHT